MVGKQIGRWTVIAEAQRPPGYKHGGKWFLCRCDCGTERPVKANSLRTKKSQSCGCLQKESVRKGKDHHFYKHGHAMKGKRTKEWRTWNAMIRRCKYPSMEDYPRYGGRGIRVCQEWAESFQSFLDYIGPAPSGDHQVDRIDNGGDYEPGNVRWSTRSEQIRNSSRARPLTHNGRTMLIGDWAEEVGINRQTIQMRLDKSGWSVHDALTKPLRKRISSS